MAGWSREGGDEIESGVIEMGEARRVKKID